MYIVTGGAGLIGSAMVWKLNQMGIKDVIIVDHLGTSDKWKHLTGLSFSEYYEREDFRKLIANDFFDASTIEGIFHLGACSATTERDATYLIDNNYRYTCEVAEYAVKNNILMMYASSCATYGDGAKGYEDNEDKIEELRPMNMYGYSKQLFDLYAKRKGYLNKLIGCKFSNVYGPGEQHKGDMRSVVIRCFEQITAEGKMRLFKSYKPEYADGEQLRDFLYVKDAVDMVWHLFKTKSCGIYNIGSGRAESWNSLAKAAFEALNKEINIEYIEMPESLRDRYQYYTCANMEKFRKTGYTKEATSLADSVKDYIVNYLVPGKELAE